MAQTGYTPISLYYTTTAAATPTTGNLNNGELAINITDGKLYYKDNTGTVKLLASNAATTNVASFQTSLGGLTPSTATTGVVTLAGTLNTASGGTGLSSYTAGDLSYYATGTTLTKLGIGAANAVLTSSGTAPQWTTSTGTGNNVLATSPTLVTPILGTPTSVTLTNATGLPLTTGVTGTLPVANGGTGITSFGTGVAAWLGTPSSANLATAVTDETGSGSLVFATSPSLTTPALSGETFSTSSAVTAGTNAQGQGALTSDYNVITTAASNPSGVTLPTATTGRKIVVVNKGANSINVYPATGGTIDGLAANASIAVAVGGTLEFNASSTTQWYSTTNSVQAAAYVTGTLAVANGGTGVTTSTGSGNTVLSTSPTLVTPVLGTPSSGTLTSCTGLPVSSGVSGLGTSVATALAVNVGSSGAVVVNGGALGTPSSGTLTNCTFPTLNQNTTGSAGSVATTNFSIVESGGKLLFKYGATTIASMDSSGNLITLANVTAYGTP